MAIDTAVNKPHEACNSGALKKPHDVFGAKPDALTITPSLRRCLKRLAENKYRRGQRTWTTPSAQDISLHSITELKVRNLVRIHFGTGRDRVTLTELGQEIVDQVAKRRKAFDA